jgi:hypothetical protein
VPHENRIGAWGSLGSIPRLPEAWGLLIVAALVFKQFTGIKLKKVVRMLTAKINDLVGIGVALMAVGIIGSSSPA